MNIARTEAAESAEDWLAREGFDLSALAEASATAVAASPEFVPDLNSYDRFLVAFSGGRDSLACLLHLLELGVPADRIEAQHHAVDGKEGSTLMDWPCTEAYCEAVCRALGVTLTYSWREGGLEAEALRQDAPTRRVWIPTENGYKPIGGRGPLGTRLKFPQVSASLTVSWCSSLCSQAFSTDA